MSTAGGAAPVGDRPQPPVPPPPVAEAAMNRAFGDLRDARQDASPKVTVGVGCGGALVCLVVLIIVGTVGEKLSVFSAVYSLLHVVALVLVFAGLGLAVFGFRGLAGGARANYLYAGGIVHTHRKTVTAVAWPDAVRMRPVHGKQQGSEGKVLAYVLTGRDGTAIPLALALVNGRDPFLDQVIDAVRRGGGVVE